MKPEISVLMAVRDGQPFLGEAVASILGQSLEDLELVVVDDGSQDDSWRELGRLATGDSRLVLLRNPNKLGLAASLNRCIESAKGRYLARQDADDVSLPQRLRQQVDFLEANPEVVLLGGAVQPMDAQGRELGPPDAQPTGDRAIRWKMHLRNAFHHPSVMLRAEALRDASGQAMAYDPELTYAQDYELWSRLLERGQGANLDSVLVRLRHHQGQASKVGWPRQQELADEVGLGCFRRSGMDRHFSREQIILMRRAGFVQANLNGAQLGTQLQCLRKFFALVDAQGGADDPQWAMVKRPFWAAMRRAWRHQGRDWRLLAGLATADPAGLAADLLRLLAGRR